MILNICLVIPSGARYFTLRDYVKICLRKFCLNFYSLKGFALQNPDKGFHPLTPQAFEKA